MEETFEEQITHKIADMPDQWDLVIEPQRSLLDLRLRELWRYRDLVMLFCAPRLRFSLQADHPRAAVVPHPSPC